MDSKIRNRVLEMANMILENNTTVRDVAKRIGYSKSTVHKDLREKSAKEIFYQDFKRFTVGNSVFGIGQITSLNAVELKDLRSRMSVYTEKEREQHEIDMMFFMLTNILTESTDLICTGQGAEQLITTAFHVADEDVENVSAQTGIVKLPGVVSRKKQLIPALTVTLEQ